MSGDWKRKKSETRTSQRASSFHFVWKRWCKGQTGETEAQEKEKVEVMINSGVGKWFVKKDFGPVRRTTDASGENGDSLWEEDDQTGSLKIRKSGRVWRWRYDRKCQAFCLLWLTRENISLRTRYYTRQRPCSILEVLRVLLEKICFQGHACCRCYMIRTRRKGVRKTEIEKEIRTLEAGLS